MNPIEGNALPLGLYRVTWTAGGTSLAAIGQTATGRRWIAPTNWLRPGVVADTAGRGRVSWADIESVEAVRP